MSDKNKATSKGSQTKQIHSNCNHNSPVLANTKPPTQIERVLLALLHHGSLTCQEAEKPPIRARHLNSVISELANSHRLEIDREQEKAKGYQGESCYLKRYSIPQHQQAKARQLVDHWRLKRSAPPIAWLKLRAAPLERHLTTAY
ncbi:MAG: hypothetical protein JJU30_13745 [Alkalimonas sp.]|nr:hypothetical protein [Alkalimonas sp.]